MVMGIVRKSGVDNEVTGRRGGTTGSSETADGATFWATPPGGGYALSMQALRLILRANTICIAPNGVTAKILHALS